MGRLIFGCIFTTLLLVTVNLYGQNNVLNCQKIKKGRFEMVGPQGGSIKIKRKSNIQIERYSRQRVKHRFTIDWIDDCNYMLTLKKSKIKSLIDDTEVKLYVSITEVNKYYYSARISSKEHGKSEKIEIQIK